MAGISPIRPIVAPRVAVKAAAPQPQPTEKKVDLAKGDRVADVVFNPKRDAIIGTVGGGLMMGGAGAITSFLFTGKGFGIPALVWGGLALGAVVGGGVSWVESALGRWGSKKLIHIGTKIVGKN